MLIFPCFVLRRYSRFTRKGRGIPKKKVRTTLILAGKIKTTHTQLLNASNEHVLIYRLGFPLWSLAIHDNMYQTLDGTLRVTIVSTCQIHNIHLLNTYRMSHFIHITCRYQTLDATRGRVGSLAKV
uniref:Uncharacterized protein n=1 Tax=Cacopsylla melanoneura TaxID=428564 RepID=A0A8D9EZY5_9HEMI